MSTLSTPVRRTFISILATIGMLFGTVAAAQPSSATTVSYTHDQLRAMAYSVLSLMNSERKAHGVAALTMSGRLSLSAYRHDLRMASTNTMSHLLPGEPSLGSRITATGFIWRACAENIGWNSDSTLNGVLYLEKIMYGERAPNDGHRRNLLNSVYRYVGIDVYYDSAHRKIWLTEDFGRLAGT